MAKLFVIVLGDQVDTKIVTKTSPDLESHQNQSTGVNPHTNYAKVHFKNSVEFARGYR